MKESPLHSMTGYGRGSSAGRRFRISVEMRSVNGRFFEFRARLPRALQFLEPKVREHCSKKLKRGAIDFVMSVHAVSPEAESVVDTPLARAYAAEVQRLARELDLSEGLTAASLLRLPGVLVERESASLEGESEVSALALKALDDALTDLLDMRRSEGEKLEKVLQRELADLRSHGERIQKHRKDLNERYFQKFRARVADWADRGQSHVDETRLYQEVAFYLDRSDVTEELDRVASHLKQCEDAVRGAFSGSIGKRLDFLAQELGREVNTIGAKCDHAQVTTHVVEMKLALERLREQVQNLE